MKRFLEMRGADGGRWRRICALPAFWVGLLYDPARSMRPGTLVKDWTAEERQALRDGVPRLALKTPFRGGKALDVAREAMAISRNGLAARARKDAMGLDERQYLAPIEEIVASGRTIAEQLLESYHGPWKGDIRQVLRSMLFSSASLFSAVAYGSAYTRRRSCPPVACSPRGLRPLTFLSLSPLSRGEG